MARKPKTLAETLEEKVSVVDLTSTPTEDTTEVSDEKKVSEPLDVEFEHEVPEELSESVTPEDGTADLEPTELVDLPPAEEEVYGVNRLKVLKKQKKYINGRVYMEITCSDNATYLLTTEEHGILVKKVRV